MRKVAKQLGCGRDDELPGKGDLVLTEANLDRTDDPVVYVLPVEMDVRGVGLGDVQLKLIGQIR
jgi:hypothetical protein